MGTIEDLKDLYEHRTTTSPGYEFEYRGYTLEKCDGRPEQSNYMILNRDGKHVETFWLAAHEDFEDFERKLDALIKYDPDNMEDSSGWREEMGVDD